MLKDDMIKEIQIEIIKSVQKTLLLNNRSMKY